MNLSDYQQLSTEQLQQRIESVKKQAGSRLTILAHYYCMDEVVDLADFSGDSLGLSEKAAAADTDAVLFCGVYFMAETADILLNRPEKISQRNGRTIPVMITDLDAGCPMADMVTLAQAEECKRQLSQIMDFSAITPITYINSSAAIKAFCGDNGGTVCTSANADRIMNWALSKSEKILFLPDEHLGRNTALKRGIDESKIVVWNPDADSSERAATLEACKKASVILWKGFCPIHQRFSVDIIQNIRTETPDAQIWVHPESPHEIVRLSDGSGSTTKLISVVNQAAPGSTLAIGTEWKLVERLRKQNPDKKFIWLGKYPSVCSNMAKSTLPKMAYVLENWIAGKIENQVQVDGRIADSAYKALQKMLSIK